MLLDLLAELIGAGKVPDTRIDLVSRILVKEEEPSDARRLRQPRERLADVTRQALKDAYITMVRLSCLEHDLVVGGASAGGNTGGGKRRGRAAASGGGRQR
jgi:hypothetical protein